MTQQQSASSGPMIDDNLRAGITAAKAGQRELARELLLQVVQQDEENISAWLWLSGLMDSPEEQEICLENVLALDPDNQAAQKGLARFRQTQAAAPAPKVDGPAKTAAPSPPPPAAPYLATEPSPLDTASPGLYQEETESATWYLDEQPEAPQPQPQDDFDNEYLCPYCAALTQANDRRCPACRKSLWIEIRKREKRSTLLWIAIGLQTINVLLTLGVLIILAYFSDAYLARMSPQASAKGMSWLIYVCGAPFFLFEVAVLAGLYLRWKPVYYLYLVNAGFSLLSAVVSLVAGAGLIGGAINVAIALGMFGLIFQMEDEFFGEKRRMALRVDRAASSGPALAAAGRRYAGQGMWAMATLHFRRAVGRAPNEIDYRLALVVAYANLKRPDLAEKVLAEARPLSPGHPEIEKLAAQVASLPRPAPPAPRPSPPRSASPASAGPKKSKYRRLKPQSE